jgi:hypothetical protein
MAKGSGRPAATWLIIGVALIGAGIWRGELSLVLAKAVQVCLQCIGIG